MLAQPARGLGHTVQFRREQAGIALFRLGQLVFPRSDIAIKLAVRNPSGRLPGDPLGSLCAQPGRLAMSIRNAATIFGRRLRCLRAAIFCFDGR